MQPLLNLINPIFSEKHSQWLAALVGMLVSAIIIYSNYNVINTDGILYIEVAKQFVAGNYEEAFKLYRWPFYPALIALTYKLTHLDYQLSAHLLTIVFFGFTSAGLVTLVKELGGSRQVMLLAGGLLFSSPYIMESMTPMIIRDHGLGASHVWSLVYFLRFYRNSQIKDSLAWGLTASLAVLFRIEAITYLVMLPLIIVLKRSSLKRFAFSLFNAYSVLIAASLVIFIFLAVNPQLAFEDLGRLAEPASVANTVLLQIQEGLAGKSEIYADQVLGNYLQDYAMAGLIITLALVLVSQAATSAGWMQLLLALYAAKNHIKLVAFRQSNIMHWLLVLGMINAAFILLSVFVLSSRYMLPVSLVIIVYASFGIAELLKHQNIETIFNLKSRQSLITLGVLMGLALQILFIFWPPNEGGKYELRAVQWASKNIPKESRIFFDQGRLRYYYDKDSSSRERVEWEVIEKKIITGELTAYDYLMIHTSTKHPYQEQWLTSFYGQPLTSFNNRQKKVLIYKIAR